MRIEVVSTEPLRFADGAPVRAASAIAPYREGWLVVQDDATHGCWLHDGEGEPLRLLPPVDGHEVFAESEGTKHLKPDLESACATPAGLLLLGSGSTPARMRSVLLAPEAGEPQVADLSRTYAEVAATLGVEPDDLNLEGACLVGDRLRWFHRGRPSAGLPTASVDVLLDPLVALATGAGGPSPVPVTDARTYDLGQVEGVGLAVTDAVAVGGAAVLVSAAAEDSPTAYDDGPVVGSALALLRGAEVVDVGHLPRLGGGVPKTEGLAVLDWTSSGGRLLATVDADDTNVASTLLTLLVRL